MFYAGTTTLSIITLKIIAFGITTLHYGTQHNSEKGCILYDKNFVLGVAMLNAIMFCTAMINGVLKSLLSLIMPSQYHYASGIMLSVICGVLLC
jgi:hypothetical protein